MLTNILKLDGIEVIDKKKQQQINGAKRLVGFGEECSQDNPIVGQQCNPLDPNACGLNYYCLYDSGAYGTCQC